LGAYSSLIAKVKAIDAKHGKFDMVICVGDFFAAPGSGDAELDALLDGKLEGIGTVFSTRSKTYLYGLRSELVPIATYTMQGEHPIPHNVVKRASENSGQICPNLFLIGTLARPCIMVQTFISLLAGKSGVITTSHKLTIASFGGKYDSEIFASGSQPLDSTESAFNSHNYNAFLSSTLLPVAPSLKPQEPSLASFQSSSRSQIDILLTNEWPASVTRHSKAAPSGILDASLVSILDDVVKASKPRYHFASSSQETPIFWEREPFVWDGDLVSRFISLGSFGASLEAAGKKQRVYLALVFRHEDLRADAS
jgi:hypothetical protein